MSTFPYNLSLGTRNLLTSGTGEMGHVLVAAAGTKGASKAGSVHIQAGPNVNVGAGFPGNIWMAPGYKSGADAGRVWLANPNSASSGTGVCTLATAGLYNVADPTAGTFYVATINGMEGFAVTVGMTLNALVTLINTTSPAITALNVGGRLVLSGYPHGPTGDIYYVGDTVGGALNTKLGDLSLPAATFTPGYWPENISFACVGADHIHFYGLVTADSGIGPGGGGGDVYTYHFVPAGSLSYAVAGGIRLVGVGTSGGITLVTLPAAPVAGRVITVKDETGNAPGNPITIQSAVPGVTIDGAPFAQINVARGSLSVYYTGNPARGWMIY
jgi:hypothetical protein